MNEQLQNFARQKLKDDLTSCTDQQQVIFKRMYSHNNLQRSINDIIDNMSEEKLNWAMQQVKRTIDKNKEKTIA